MAAFAEATRAIAVFYDGVVVPGALLLATSGGWLIVTRYGGWDFLHVPWLVGMVVLFLFEFVEGNTITRIAFMRLRRLAAESSAEGQCSPALLRERRRLLPSFTHFLDLPVLLVILALGVLKPADLSLAFAGVVCALLLAGLLTWTLTGKTLAEPASKPAEG
ncbi:MAG: DUF2269 family protein [Burkholderiales bacterium]|nr:MAG: DUF2269 family protein [Burkholderiales bacterium]